MKPNDKGSMHLGLFLKATGHHIAARHHPGVALDAPTNAAHFIDPAKPAEEAALDFVFFADSRGVREGKPDYTSPFPNFIAYREPLTLLAARAGHPSRVGLRSEAMRL